MRKIIGYSFWGFLGNGIIDTPDGGRIHRLPFIKALINNGFDIILLQKNRDLDETNHKVLEEGLTFSPSGFPDIDYLFLEYRWIINGRNNLTNKQYPEYTPDYDRQEELIAYYKGKIPIAVWDKDLKLKNDNEFDLVFENTFITNPHRKRLLFSLDEKLLKDTIKKLSEYEISSKNHDLVYVGNQYERDESFQIYINQAAKSLNSKTRVYGNWNKYPERYLLNKEQFNNVSFQERIGFENMANIYSESLCTVLIAPQRYYTKGQITQRLFEATLSLCIPLIPKEYYGVNEFIVEELIVKNSTDVVDKINEIKQNGSEYVKILLSKQLEKLEIFLASHQAKTVKYEFEKI
jgi:hypothetical protein